jgi:hypothetical protein
MAQPVYFPLLRFGKANYISTVMVVTALLT